MTFTTNTEDPVIRAALIKQNKALQLRNLLRIIRG